MEIKSRKVVYKCPIFKVEEREVVTYSGAEKTFYVVVREPHVATIALTNDKKIILIKEICGKEDYNVITFPSGKVDKENATQEEIEQQALAELEEEAGYKANKIELLSKLPSKMNTYERDFYKFVAWDIEEVGQKLETGETIEPYYFSIEEAKKLIEERKMTFSQDERALIKALEFFEKKGLL